MCVRERERERDNSNSKIVIKVLPILQTQISTTIPQTDIISTNKQLINAVSQSSYKCAEISESERERERPGRWEWEWFRNKSLVLLFV